ncbi:peptide/nickel transport system ATP-binding protein [Streptomyces sp. TLI_053]|uniref:ABC transporter ATP-binding protein n=1 Tax=Streptomyces sp. TLI_053 TaxID=1855352 RepID=UPI0008794042|nr:ATP-binding cassette domain-containing protein [Streptomyces sp. TLI_053]SDT79412.1 peptide/nickel transport system ATP-binding protein [Streptomyces sp. TLI_053]
MSRDASGPVLAAVEGLRVRVGARVLVDGVSLRVRAGRVTALVGPSGSGKTTTALALLGARPDGARVSGTISVAGAGGVPVGHVPQHPATVLNPARRVGVLLRDLARVHGGGPEAVRRALRDAELSEVESLLRRYPHQLSGGQQQRLVLAQALLTGARVIVADEPTTGQDPATAHRLAALFGRLAARGTGLLLLTHDLALVRASADEVVLLADGRAVRTGPPDEVLPAPARPEPSARPEPLVRAEPPLAHPVPAARRELSPVRLEARGLTARHPGGAVVLREVGLSLRAGECLALTGPTGSGKTTLGRCLAGLHPRHEGTVLLDGEPLPSSVRRRGPRRLAAVQYVFQDARSAFADHRPVLDQVARAAVRLRGRTPAAAAAESADLLADLGLDPAKAARPPGGLSGGELQRAALARSLIVGPAVLVCDEITAGLDADTRASILAHLADRRDRAGLALLFVSHDPAAVAALADRVVTLADGRLHPASAAHPFGRQDAAPPG